MFEKTKQNSKCIARISTTVFENVNLLTATMGNVTRNNI